MQLTIYFLPHLLTELLHQQHQQILRYGLLLEGILFQLLLEMMC
jgi:hypothetical protein